MCDARPILRSLLAQLSGPLPHSSARALVSQQLGRMVEPEEYFEAVEWLVREGLAGRSRGQGGSIFPLVTETTVEESQDVYWTEPRLMPALGRFLETQYWRSIDQPTGGLWLVIDTSAMRPSSGKWSHPDFTIVSVMPLQILPTRLLDVHSFELKAEAACNLTSVHEALAQTRQTHFGTVVWHLPIGSPHTSRLTDVEQACEMHGIGLLLVRDPQDGGSWEQRTAPTRKPTPIEDIDGFLAARLTAEQKTRLLQALSGASGG